MPHAPIPTWSARVLHGWQIGLLWGLIVVSALLVVVPFAFLLLPHGPLGLAFSGLGTLLLALLVPLARATVVELRIEPHRLVARRMLGAPITVGRAEVRDVVVASRYLQPRRHDVPLEAMRVMVVGHDGRTYVAATWYTVPFDPPAFFAMWGVRPFLLPERMLAPELERRVPGSTSRLGRLGPTMLVVIAVLLAVEAVAGGLVLLVAQVVR